MQIAETPANTQSPYCINDTKTECSLFQMWSTGWKLAEEQTHSSPLKLLHHLQDKAMFKQNQGFTEDESVRKSS